MLIFLKSNLFSFATCYKNIFKTTYNIYNGIYKKYSEEELVKYANLYIAKENSRRGYLVGLSNKISIKNVIDLKQDKESFYSFIGNSLNILNSKQYLTIVLGNKFYTGYYSDLVIYIMFSRLFYEFYNFKYYDKEIEERFNKTGLIFY